MIVTPDRADALLMPESLKRGATTITRFYSVAPIAEALLGADRDAGQRVCTRVQQPTTLPVGIVGEDRGNMLFWTLDVNATIYFPQGHPRQGHSRYTWIKFHSGIWKGFLVPEALESSHAGREAVPPSLV